MGVRVRNVQTRGNVNTGYQNVLLNHGSQFIKDYMSALSDGRNTWQRVWETEVGTTVQSERETVDKTYVVDYLSVANRDIMVYEKGSFVQRNVYDVNGRRMSTELSYADGTQRGDPGENIASDTAVALQKVWYRTSHLGSTLYAVDKNGAVLTHTVYDPWGNPITEAKTDLNFSGLDNRNNYTGYTWDEVLGLYFAQARFYDPLIHRFTQEDPARDGTNWYVYCANNPRNVVDVTGEFGTPIQWACAVIGGIAGWYFGDYVARQFGHTEGCVYWAIRAGVVIGGAVIGWFAGTAVLKLATNYLVKNPAILAKVPNVVKWFLGLKTAQQAAVTVGQQIGQLTNAFLAKWQDAEAFIRKAINGVAKGFDTPFGRRIADAFNTSTRVIAESKYGYASATEFILKEAQKDFYLLQEGIVSKVEWHFFISAVTGKGGPSANLLQQLLKYGFTIIYH